MKYIYHHLGLGDHIICNGLVRHFVEKYNEIFLFCKNHNKESVEFMYLDDPRIHIILFPTDMDVNNYIHTNNIENETIRVGFDRIYSSTKGFDVNFYEQFELSIDDRWNKFKIKRNLDREKKLFDHFSVKSKEYIFIHEDDRFKIDYNKINIKNNKIVIPKKEITENIFDYLMLIENALEVHTIESSFQFIIDSMALNKENYVHRYSRSQHNFELPTYKNVKKIIN